MAFKPCEGFRKLRDDFEKSSFLEKKSSLGILGASEFKMVLVDEFCCEKKEKITLSYYDRPLKNNHW